MKVDLNTVAQKVLPKSIYKGGRRPYLKSIIKAIQDLPDKRHRQLLKKRLRQGAPLAQAAYDALTLRDPGKHLCRCGCGKPTQFVGKRYSQYAQRGCSLRDPKVKQSIRKALLDKYGVTNPSHIEGAKEKKIETCRRNYGVDFPQQSYEVRRKSVQTLFDKYGVTNISRDNAVLQKKKETWLAKYGVDNPFKMESVKELAGQVSVEERTRRHLKGIKTLQARYQTDASNAMRVPSIAAKAIASRKRNLINEYGTYDKGLAALARKTKETYLKRYGTTNMRELDWYIRKMEETYYWRYQVRTSYPTHIADIMEKVLSARYKLRPVTVKKKTYAVRSQLEAEVIEKLLRRYKVTDLTTETREIVTIPYEYQGISRRYYPDIKYISPIGKAEVAEVKSFYTMGLVPFNRSLIDKNLAKFKAAFKTVSNFVIYLQLPKVGVVRLTTPEEVMRVVRSYRP